jgi:hypothetical protein
MEAKIATKHTAELSAAAAKALVKHGQLTLLTAWYACDVQGEGANSIRLTVNLPGVPNSVAAVDSVINAGRELVKALRAGGGVSYRQDGSAAGFGGTGVDVFRAAVIASGLSLYAKTGMRPNRAYTPTAMIRAAGEMTGRKYKAREYDRASEDLSALCQLLKVAIGGEGL